MDYMWCFVDTNDMLVGKLNHIQAFDESDAMDIIYEIMDESPETEEYVKFRHLQLDICLMEVSKGSRIRQLVPFDFDKDKCDIDDFEEDEFDE